MFSHSKINTSIVRPDDNMAFECTVNNSHLIGWSSDDYISSGGVRLELCDNATSRENSQVSTCYSCSPEY